MLLAILILTVVVVVYLYSIRPYTYWKKKGVPQFDPRWFLGDLWSTILRRETFQEFITKLYESPEQRFVGVYQFSKPTLFLKDLELIKKICVQDFDHFTDHKRFLPKGNDPLWDNVVFALEGAEWREMRSLLSPSFTSSKLKFMFSLIENCANNFVDFFAKQNADIVEVEFKEMFSRYTADVIATTAFGVEVDSMAEPENELRVKGKEATNLWGYVKGMKLLGYLVVPSLYKMFKISIFNKAVTKFFYDLVGETIRVREEKGIIRHDMIHLLVEARKAAQKRGNGSGVSCPLTNESIASQVMIFFFAGFESVSTTMSFIAYELGRNPDIQSRLREEIQETFADCDGTLTYEKLLGMKYIDMVISEGMRRWPVLPIIDRACTKEYIIEPSNPGEKPIQIDQGDIVWIPCYNIHNDPKYFPEPDRFDPERFNDEDKSKLNSLSYMAFGQGPRACIGNRFAMLEMKMLFFYLLLNFDIVTVAKSKIPLEVDMVLVNLHVKDGVWFGLKKLSNNKKYYFESVTFRIKMFYVIK